MPNMVIFGPGPPKIRNFDKCTDSMYANQEPSLIRIMHTVEVKEIQTVMVMVIRIWVFLPTIVRWYQLLLKRGSLKKDVTLHRLSNNGGLVMFLMLRCGVGVVVWGVEFVVVWISMFS